MWSPCHPSFPSYPYSDSPTNGELLAYEVFTLKRLDSSQGNNFNNSNRPSDNMDGGLKQTFGGYEENQTHQKTAVPQIPVAPLSFSLRSPRVGTVSPLISPQTPGGGKEPFIPSSPAHKGNSFWAVVPPMPPSPASRPGSFSFPNDNSCGGDSLGRGMASFHRNSSHRQPGKQGVCQGRNWKGFYCAQIDSLSATLFNCNLICLLSLQLLNPNFIYDEFLIPLSDASCESGDNVTLRCKVCGRPRAIVSWRGPDNSILSNNGRHSIAYRYKLVSNQYVLMSLSYLMLCCPFPLDHCSETGEASLRVLGVVTYVLLSGASPFLDESLEETCLNICRLDFSFPDDYFQGVSTEAKDFVCLLLQGEPERRPSAGFCLQYPWLQPRGVAGGGYGHVNHTQPPSPSHYATQLDTSRLISFIERRKHQNDVRPVGTIKSFLQSRLYNHT
ncbi:hypothetical protein XENOCAPTIV_003052 [Xenoophorus captivus]|uniref:Ig-like domain-containing protein n=1 Tax=Xenoophorus captivus TaxID=1517983 RepID=A0ABV0RF65_9TELE